MRKKCANDAAQPAFAMHYDDDEAQIEDIRGGVVDDPARDAFSRSSMTTIRVDQHGFRLIEPERRTIIAIKFTIELDIGHSFFGGLPCRSD